MPLTETEPTDKRQFNVYLPPELIRAVKIASVDAGLSLSAYVEQALRRQLVPHEAVGLRGKQ